MRYLVKYNYDGGAGADIVEASSVDEATLVGMHNAKPKYSRDPKTTVTHASTIRIMYHSEMMSEPLAGLRSAIFFTRRKADDGKKFLLIERGNRDDSDGKTYWYDNGVVVGTYSTEKSAKAAAKSAWQLSHDRGVSALYTVVPRNLIEIILHDEPTSYGAFSGTASALGNDL